MATELIDRDSTELLGVLVRRRRRSLELNPSLYPIQLAFTTPGERPVAQDWVDGSWAHSDGQWWGECLVGPLGGKSLVPGDYDVWCRIVAGVETLVRRTGCLKVE